MGLRPIDAWYLFQNIEKMYWGATAATIGSGLTRMALTGNPQTLRLAGQMASLGARAHMHAIRGVLGTTLVRGGTTTVGGALAKGAASVGAGYALGAAAGIGISRSVFGESGMESAIDLYSSPMKFWNEGIFGAPRNISTIVGNLLS